MTRKILSSRPTLGTCCCGGQPDFVSSVTDRVVDVRDNGLMPKKVEQLANIDELIKKR